MKALAELWLQWGEARDLILAIERDPKDPRRPFLEKLRGLTDQLEGQLSRKDLAEAVPISGDLAQVKTRANERLLAPSVKLGRYLNPDFQRGRNEANDARRQAAAAEWARWNDCAKPHWKPGISKNAVARIVQSKLGLDPKQVPSIARRLKKPLQAS